MDHRKNEFVPGIEGLRAVAILAVLLNHLDAAFIPGGYLGVDLFFVISGFVVSRSLDMVNTDSLKDYIVTFYSKRLKRLFPGLLVSVLFITIIGTLFFEGLGKSTVRTGATALLGFSNLYLIHINTDYFGLGSEFNLFLPTWSLGIEEQFYFFFPLFLFWLKFRKYSIAKWLSAVFIISFITFLVSHFLSKNFQYYFPLSRLWELLTGSILYFYTTKRNFDQFKHPLIAPGLMLLLTFVFFIPNLFPSLLTYQYFTFAAPAVCLISVGLILSSTKFNSPVLSNSVLMYIGKISYSIYLYHYAVLKIINPGPSWGLRILSIMVVFIISMMSFYLIETPIREKKWKRPTAKNLFLFSGSIAATCLLVFVLTRTMPEKDPFMRPTQAEYKIEQCQLVDNPTRECKLSSPGKPQLYFIGDSHSNALTPAMLKLHNLDHYEIYSLSSSGLFTSTMDRHNRNGMRELNIKNVNFVLDKALPGSTVIITNQLMTWFSNTFNDDPEAHRLTLDGKLLSHEEALKNYIAEKRGWANTLKNKNINLIITAPFPDFPLHPAKCYSPLRVAMGLDVFDSRCQTSRENQEIRRKKIVQALNKLASEESNIKIFDPIDLICNQELCNSYKGSKPLYYDDDHVNFNLSQDIYLKLSELIK